MAICVPRPVNCLSWVDGHKPLPVSGQVISHVGHSDDGYGGRIEHALTGGLRLEVWCMGESRLRGLVGPFRGRSRLLLGMAEPCSHTGSTRTQPFIRINAATTVWYSLLKLIEDCRGVLKELRVSF